MTIRRVRLSLTRLGRLVVLAAAFAGCEDGSMSGGPTTPSRNTLTVGPNQSITRIQAAIDFAGSGATIVVLPGTYGERLVIPKPMKLEGRQAVLDGLAGGLDGRFAGIEVKASDVEVTGFTIQNYERGIVVESAANFRLLGNEVRNNTSKDPPPISAGVTKSDGVVLWAVQNSEIADNFIHDNGSIGLLMSRSGSGKTVRRNRFVNNGTQQGLPGSGYFGASILTDDDRDLIVDNEMSGSYWGIIMYGRNSTVRSNRITGNSRAGIMIYGLQNVIESNVATGNGSANFDPSCRFDLMDIRDIDNTWRNNAGAFGSGEPPHVNPTVSLLCPGN